MIFPKQPAQLCEFCNLRESCDIQNSLKPSRPICDTCFARLEVQRIAETRMGAISELWFGGEVDAALASLAQMYEENRHRDHDLWLARTIVSYRAMILLDAERIQEAEQACEEWERLGFADVWQRWEHASLKADVWCAMGREEDAARILEDALAYRDPKHLGIEISYLAQLAELYAQRAIPMEEHWTLRLQEIADHYGVAYPNENSVIASILRFRDETLQTRFSLTA